MIKLEPPPIPTKINITTNRHVLAARLRAIATLIKNGKTVAAWHALTALAERLDPK